MSELAPPLTRTRRGYARLEAIERLTAQSARLLSLARLEMNALLTEDTAPGMQGYLADELSLLLAESPGTAGRLLTMAHIYASYPAVVERVGLPLALGGWSLRHADALLEAIMGVSLTPKQQQAVVDWVAGHPDARTPHQIRKAAQAAVLIADPEAAARRYDKAKANRRIGSEDWGNGSASFYAHATTSQVASVLASLDALAGPKQPGETRNLDQRRFDAFMDLTSGRIQAGQWQALIIVPLATLEGGDEPAEIPGHGLVCAEEARDILAVAEFRRAVVDEHGTLVSVDSRVHRPDLTEVTQPEPHPDSRLSLEAEPEALDLTPEHTPADADLAWLDQQNEPQPAEREPDVLDEEHEALVTTALSTLESELTALLTRPLVTAGSGRTDLRFRPERFDLHAPGWHHGSDGSEGPGGPQGPRDPFDPPDPPSPTDVLWHDEHQDRDAQDAQEPPPRYEQEPDSPPQPESIRSAWTRHGLTLAHARLRTRPVEPAPADSTSYVLPVPMARFIKHRDIVCTFPGCRRLARDCHSDHLDPWPIGPTSIHNTSSECVHHHQAKHAYFTVTRGPHASLIWTTPHGRSYTRHARPLLRGW